MDKIKNVYQEAVSNINKLTERIIRYFGKHAINIYGLQETEIQNFL
jgi:hypothetical protein